MSTETSTRPFQLGDPVKITDYDVMTGKTIRTHTGKIRSLQDMSASDASDWVTCIADVDEPYLMGKSEMLHTVAIVHLVLDRTRSTCPSNQTIELLEPAPADSPGEAPQDHGPLAATLSDRTLAKVLSRPAHVPSLVLLDRDAAAQVLANAVADLLQVIDSDDPHVELAVQALADYRSAVQS